MDYNRWNGTVEDMRAYFGYSEVVQPPLTDSEKLAIMLDYHPEVHP